MSSETAHEPAAKRQSMSLGTGTDAISGILSQEQASDEELQASKEVEEQQEQEEPAQESETEDLTEEEAEQSEESEEETEEAEEETEVEAKDEEEVTSEDIELEPAQVAELLGLDENAIAVEEDGAVLVNAKVNGKPAKVALKDLAHSYELAETHRERLSELGRDRKTFDEERTTALQNLTTQHNQFAQTVQAIEQDYAQNFEQVNWNQLRQDDQVEYNSKKLEFDERRQQIQNYRAQLTQQQQQMQQQYTNDLKEKQAKGSTLLEEVFTGEAYKAAPAWERQEQERLSKWMIDQGFSAEDISQVGVWQVFKWARDSMLRESELQQATEAIKKVIKLPKINKSGKTMPAKEVARSKFKVLKAKQRDSGGDLKSTESLIGSMLGEQRR